MWKWTVINELESVDAFEAYRDMDLCCGAIYHTVRRAWCKVCFGNHVMIERLLRCQSETCGSRSSRPVRWKAYQCSANNTWRVVVNGLNHNRGSIPCLSILKPKLMKAIKAFVSKQDQLSVPPRVILADLKKLPDISEPRGGWPTLLQLYGFLKRDRRDGGAKNSLKAIRELVRERSPANAKSAQQAFLFGDELDIEGYPYVGSGEDENPFILGATSKRLLENALSYASSGHRCMLHADATFKISDLGYPVIVCGITDQARSYQLVALFVVSQRTSREYAACFRSLVYHTRRVRSAAARRLRDG